jgi:hypothetical protein
MPDSPENPQNLDRSQNRLVNTGRTRFKPGNRANPGGRPKGLMQYVRGVTKDGHELADIALKIARGTLIIVEQFKDADGNVRKLEHRPSHRDRLAAIEFLAERGFGKCLSTVALQNPDGSKLFDGAAERASTTDLKAELARRGALDANGRLILQEN